MGCRRGEKISEKNIFLLDISEYDVIIGYRAEFLFSFAQDFVGGKTLKL